MKTTKILAAVAGSAVLLAEPALAHPGHGLSGLAAGLAHPFTGLDHLLAMVAVGVWAATQPSVRAWQGPAAFLAMLAAGALLGVTGTSLPMVEPGIIASVVLLGLMIAGGRAVPAQAGLLLIGLFALLHGHAHGTEAVGAVGGYLAGFMIVSATLHLAGFVLGRTVLLGRLGAPATGLAFAVAGLGLVGA